jgi:hypothetical protein
MLAFKEGESEASGPAILPLKNPPSREVGSYEGNRLTKNMLNSYKLSILI